MRLNLPCNKSDPVLTRNLPFDTRNYFCIWNYFFVTKALPSKIHSTIDHGYHERIDPLVVFLYGDRKYLSQCIKLSHPPLIFYWVSLNKSYHLILNVVNPQWSIGTWFLYDSPILDYETTRGVIFWQIYPCYHIFFIVPPTIVCRIYRSSRCFVLI